MGQAEYDLDTLARSILFSVREQMARFKEHNIEPGYVLMTAEAYLVLRRLLDFDPDVCLNSDVDTINELQIVVNEKFTTPIVTAKPSALLKAGLL